MQAEFVGNYTNVTTTATSVIARPGVGGGGILLHCITFNKPVATGTVTIYDNTAASGTTIATITVPASPQPVTLFYDVICGQGLTIAEGVIAQDITVSWR